MVQVQWQAIAWIVYALILVWGIVQGVTRLYVAIYTQAYNLGRSKMEAEDTAQLVKSIAELKADYPGSEEVLIALYTKLTGGTTEPKKEEKEKEKEPIGFGPSKKS